MLLIDMVIFYIFVALIMIIWYDEIEYQYFYFKLFLRTTFVVFL